MNNMNNIDDKYEYLFNYDFENWEVELFYDKETSFEDINIQARLPKLIMNSIAPLIRVYLDDMLDDEDDVDDVDDKYHEDKLNDAYIDLNELLFNLITINCDYNFDSNNMGGFPTPDLQVFDAENKIIKLAMYSGDSIIIEDVIRPMTKKLMRVNKIDKIIE